MNFLMALYKDLKIVDVKFTLDSDTLVTREELLIMNHPHIITNCLPEISIVDPR